jgi:hypothetical protein
MTWDKSLLADILAAVVAENEGISIRWDGKHIQDCHHGQKGDEDSAYE